MTIDNRYVELTQKVELFHGLNPLDVEKIFQKGMTLRAQQGETIFFEGTIGNRMYVVLGGEITIKEKQKYLATLSTGDMFGEMAMISNTPRTATAVATQPSLLFVLNESVFQKLLTKRVAIQLLLNIVQTLSGRLQETNLKVVELTNQLNS